MQYEITPRRVYKHLTDEQRLIIGSMYTSGHKLKEIGQAAGCPSSTVGSEVERQRALGIITIRRCKPRTSPKRTSWLKRLLRKLGR